MRLTIPRRMIQQNLLTGVWFIVAPVPLEPVRVPHIVPVLFVELVFSRVGEAGAPEDETFFDRKTNAFEEERVLQPAKMFEMFLGAEGAVEVEHAGGEVLGEGVDGGGGDGGAGERGGLRGVVFGGGETVREVV